MCLATADAESGKLLFVVVTAVALTTGGARGRRADAGRRRRNFLDGGGQEVLQSIFVPFMANAPGSPA